MDKTTNLAIYIIAEAGVNHNGDLARAIAMVDFASKCGADAIKFQTFIPEALVSRNAAKANYQLATTAASESQLEMIKRLALSFDDHFILLDHCKKRNIDFLSSPFDHESASFLLSELKLPRIKLGSGEITNAPLLLHIAKQGTPIILSTGMSTLEEVRTALSVLGYGYLQLSEAPSPASFDRCLEREDTWNILKQKVTLLHCTTEYPCPYEEVNLRAMDTLHDIFGLNVGYSDHTPGIWISIAAAARGAVILEKHFTLDRALPGPDHKASLEPVELQALVKGVREVCLAMGNGIKQPTASELSNMKVARKSLVARRNIKQGELLSAENLTVKRPGSGIPPLRYWEMLGRPAARDYTEDELL